jgi:Icc-related predicted phosphoesterase
MELKMKLRICSDLHLEFYQYKNPMSSYGKDITETYVLPEMEDEQEQILVLAGDICTSGYIYHYHAFFENLSKRFKKVIAIMGNHEHYRGNFNASENILKAFYNQFDITLLEKEIIFIDGVAFFGATMWSDLDKENPLTIFKAHDFTDYKYIQYGPEDNCAPLVNLQPRQTLQHFRETISSLENFLSLPNDKKCVITHHAPSHQSVAEPFRGHPMNGAFVSDLDNMIWDSNISLWIHGHVHNNFDYNINKTRIACNPFGYWRENSRFIKDLVLTI